MRAKAVETWMSSTQIILIVPMATAHHRLSRCSDISIRFWSKNQKPWRQFRNQKFRCTRRWNCELEFKRLISISWFPNTSRLKIWCARHWKYRNDEETIFINDSDERWHQSIVCFQPSIVVRQLFATAWIAIIAGPDQVFLSADQTVTKECEKDDISIEAVCLQCGGFGCCRCAVALWQSRLAQLLLIRIKPSSVPELTAFSWIPIPIPVYCSALKGLA